MNSIVNSIVNSKTILEMAHEAGLGDAEGWINEEYEYKKEILAFAVLVADAEREANAKTVDHILKEGGGTYGDAIRARGNT